MRISLSWLQELVHITIPPDDLAEKLTMSGFEVEEIPASELDHVEISSTKIRNALHEGDVKTANAYLGSRFEFSGTVIEGKKLGRKLGYPTANIQIADPYKIKPANGVYVVKAFYDGKEFWGMV